MKLESTRAGKLDDNVHENPCFIPVSLPIADLEFQPKLIAKIVDASHWLGKLSEAISRSAYAEQIFAMLAKKEAVASAQIEGAKCSLFDLLTVRSITSLNADIQEAFNYSVALRYGMVRLKTLPFSTRFAQELHQMIFSGVSHYEGTPGQVRHIDVFLDDDGHGPAFANSVPPSPNYLEGLMQNWDDFNANDNETSPLVKIALAHYQFEIIFPFLDGNGRVGRALIPLYLYQTGMLSLPILYYSLFIKENYAHYQGLLNNVRCKGEYEPFLAFFLDGVAKSCQHSFIDIERIEALHAELEDKDLSGVSPVAYQNALKLMFDRPYFNAQDLVSSLKVSKAYVGRIIKSMLEEKIIAPIDPKKERNIVYRFTKYADILERGL